MDATDQQVQSLAEEILARPEYLRDASDLSSRIYVEILLALGRLLDWLGVLYETERILFYLLVGAAGVALLGLVVLIGWGMARSLERSPQHRLDRRLATRRDYVREARALAESGRHLEAVHAMVLGTLERVGRARVIELRPELTNRMIRLRLADSTLPESVRGGLIGLLERTERARFRDGDAEPSLYEEWVSLYTRLDGELARA